MPLNSITIQLDRPRAVYNQGEHLTGRLLVESKQGLRHDGLLLSIEGHVDVTTNFRTLNLLDTFAGTSRTIPLIDFTYELVPAGRLEPGLTEVPFKMLLDESVDAPILYETYHGVFISIQYFLKCRLKRPIFHRDLVETLEFIVEYDAEPIGAPPLAKQPIKFEITPEGLSAPRRELIPNFKISGQLDGELFRLNEPLTGEFVVESCEATIRSVELQLVRVETYGNFCQTPNATTAAGMTTTDASPKNWPVDDKYLSRDATEVQNIQIGDGDILRQTPMSIYMVLPRLFTCPTLITNNFKIEFELNLVIIFDDNHLITENFPIKLIRSTLQPINMD